MLPAYLFEAIPNPSTSPFGLRLPSSLAFATQPGTFIACARCRFPSPKLSNVLLTSAALRDFHPSGLKRSVRG
jgi:hypothetical protein